MTTQRLNSEGHPFITTREAGERIAKIDGLDLRVGDTFRYYDGYHRSYMYQTITAITKIEPPRHGSDHGTLHCASGANITRTPGETELVVR